jgi:hypothetical protein
MNRWLSCSVALATLSCTGAASAQPVTQDGIGDWALEPSPVRCVISRRFGSPDDPVTLGFKAPALGEVLQVVVLRSGHRSRIEQTDAKLTIGTRESETTAMNYPLDARGRRVAHLINLSGEDAAALRQTGDLDIRVKEGVNRSFSLGSMARAWAQLDSCLQHLRRDWHIDEAPGARIVARPEPVVPLRQLFNGDDYPISVLRANQTGMTGVMLLVDESGTVKDCTLIETSGISTLDSRSCGIILERARFRPATDAEGRPLKSAVTARIRWALAF